MKSAWNVSCASSRVVRALLSVQDKDWAMGKKFAGKVAVVTGGSAGMGLATAKRFVEEGMDHVFITGRGKDALDAAVADIGKNLTAVQGDVARLTDLDRLYDAVKKHSRKIAIIFANGGLAKLASFSTVDERFFDLHFNANVRGLFFSVQKGLPLIKNGGSIVLKGSIADIKGFPAMSVYSALHPAGLLARPYKSVGNALDRLHDEPEYRLPIPARYVVDKQGIICAADGTQITQFALNLPKRSGSYGC